MAIPAVAFSDGLRQARSYRTAGRTDLSATGTDLGSRVDDINAPRFWEKGARHLAERNTVFGRNPYNLPVIWRYQLFSAVAVANHYLPKL